MLCCTFLMLIDWLILDDAWSRYSNLNSMNRTPKAVVENKTNKGSSVRILLINA